MKININLETPPVSSAFKDHLCVRGRQKRGYGALQTREKICQKFGVFSDYIASTLRTLLKIYKLFYIFLL